MGENLLKRKTLLFSIWGAESEGDHFRSWYFALKKVFKEVILFDPRQKRLEYGPGLMKQKLLDLIEREKPDYFLFLTESSELNIDTIKEINKISHKTKTIVHFGDDDINFEERSRYYALFLDYCLVGQTDYVGEYRKDGLKNAFPLPTPVSFEEFKPLKVKKKYDVSFIGQPLESRIKLIRFLVKNGIKVNIWGYGWEDYGEFKDLYKGTLDSDEFVKITNESKINLGFSKNQFGKPHFKGRVFQIPACKSFQLVEYFSGYLDYLKEGKEIVMFKDEKDLLEKIKYYLKNEKKREKIAENSYKKVIKNNDVATMFKRILGKDLENESSRDLPKLDKKIILIRKRDMKNIEEVKKKVEDYDYIYFSDGKEKSSEDKNYLQAYSLEKTDRDISCCGYFVYSNILGNYLKLNMVRGFERLGEESFNDLLNINQLMVKRDYFLKNFEKFKSSFSNGKIDFVKKENTSFIKIPLLQIKGLSKVNYSRIKQLPNENLKDAFQMEFMFKLQSLIYRKKLFLDSYGYKLLMSSLLKNGFIFRYLYSSRKDNLARIKGN